MSYKGPIKHEYMLGKTIHSMRQTSIEKSKCMSVQIHYTSGKTCPMFISNALTLIQIILHHITEIYLGLQMYTSDQKLQCDC